MHQDIIRDTFDCLRRCQDVEYDAGISLQAHLLQAAAFAIQHEAPEHLIAAALLHDLGQLFQRETPPPEDSEDEDMHEAMAAQWLRERFMDSVVEPVRLHVAAKRYLCATSPSYVEELTEASRQRLGEQGGPMNQDEVRAFELQPYYWEAVKLRSFDEMARVKGMRTPELERFRPYLMACMRPVR